MLTDVQFSKIMWENQLYYQFYTGVMNSWKK